MSHKIMSQATKGCMVGSLIGLVLGATTSFANMMLYEEQEPLGYVDSKQRFHKFRNMKEYTNVFSVAENLRALMKYRSYNERAYNSGCVFTQRLFDIKASFVTDRKAGKDAAAHVASYQAIAMKADRQWRRLFQSVKAANDTIGLKEAQDAAMDLHVAYENILADMRTEFQSNPQIKLAS